MDFLYRRAMVDLTEDLNELMADLEDTRDDAQECLDQTTDAVAAADVARMDKALRLLAEAADALDIEEIEGE